MTGSTSRLIRLSRPPSYEALCSRQKADWRGSPVDLGAFRGGLHACSTLHSVGLPANVNRYDCGLVMETDPIAPDVSAKTSATPKHTSRLHALRTLVGRTFVDWFADD